jgi:hypothetical protein
MKDELTGYDLSRNFFDWSYENPELIKPTHIAIYFFAIEHCNRLGWKPKFGFPTQMTMDAIGVKNWRTYIKAFTDLCDWGFFELLEKSKNQYSANVIAIVKNTKANTKALTKASQKHIQKQVNSTYKSTVGINKLYNLETLEQIETNNENEIVLKKKIIENLIEKSSLSSEEVFALFKKWVSYMEKQHDVIIRNNEFAYDILIDAIKRVGADKLKDSIEYSIVAGYKRIYEKPAETNFNNKKNLKHLNQTAKYDCDKFS